MAIAKLCGLNCAASDKIDSRRPGDVLILNESYGTSVPEVRWSLERGSAYEEFQCIKYRKHASKNFCVSGLAPMCDKGNALM